MAGVILSFSAIILLCIPLRNANDYGYRTALVTSNSSHSTKTDPTAEDDYETVVYKADLSDAWDLKHV